MSGGRWWGSAPQAEAVRVRRVIPYRSGARDPRYWVEIAEQPLSRALLSFLYEVYYWRLGWVVRRLDPLNRHMHERTCRLCRAARSVGSKEGFIEHEGLLYNVHYEPLFARQDERSFDLDRKGRDRIAWLEIDQAAYRRLARTRCSLGGPPRRLRRRMDEQQDKDGMG